MSIDIIWSIPISEESLSGTRRYGTGSYLYLLNSVYTL